MSIQVHLKALVLPLTVTGIIPAVILVFSAAPGPGWHLTAPYACSVIAVAILLIMSGLSLLAYTIRLFSTIGKGTLAPWSPTRKLVVTGPYRYLRNPMISGVLVILAGEAFLYGSLWLAGYTVLFFLLNHFYFIYSEEPGLARRFDREYRDYRKNVPRWIPRLKPWKG